jgi:phage protein D
VGTIVRSIAAQNKLKVSIDKEIEQRKIGHADQAQESDASFLRRLGSKWTACATSRTAPCFSARRARPARPAARAAARHHHPRRGRPAPLGTLRP